jgi:AmiR/NasT family two-component response regulator
MHQSDKTGDRGNGRNPLISPEGAGLDIIAVAAHDDDGDFLLRELVRTRARVRRVWPLPNRLPEEVDVIVCDLVPGLLQVIPWLPGEPKAALVGIMPTVGPPDLLLLRNCTPDAVLHRPFTAQAILTSLALARDHFLYQKRLRTRIEKLDETLRGFRSVEQAKTILMHTRRMDEDAAYRFIRTQAMNRRVSISAVAAAIIDSNEVLG